MSEELEYRYPVKLLTNRDPIIAGKLSILEMIEWVVFASVMYAEFNWLPSFIIFAFRLSLVVITLAVAFVFIHTQVNGLSPLEWIFVNSRSWMERGTHQAIGWLSQQRNLQQNETEANTNAVTTLTNKTTAIRKDKLPALSSSSKQTHSILASPSGSNRHKPSFQSMVVTLNSSSTKPEPEEPAQTVSKEAELVEEI